MPASVPVAWSLPKKNTLSRRGSTQRVMSRSRTTPDRRLENVITNDTTKWTEARLCRDGLVLGCIRRTRDLLILGIATLTKNATIERPAKYRLRDLDSGLNQRFRKVVGKSLDALEAESKPRKWAFNFQVGRLHIIKIIKLEFHDSISGLNAQTQVRFPA